MGAKFKVGDVLRQKSNRESFKIEKILSTGLRRYVLSDRFSSESTHTSLELIADYDVLDWKDGDILESDLFIVSFKEFYEVNVAKCNWITSKTNNEDMGVLEDTRIIVSYFDKVDKECAKLEGIMNIASKLCDTQKPDSYDYINPSHYRIGGMETFDMMVMIWGKEKAIAHCEMTSFKYRMRAGKKPDQPIERDMEKAKWYDNKANELRNELHKETK